MKQRGKYNWSPIPEMAPDCRHLVTKQNSDLHVFKKGRRELGPETNSAHLPWRIRTTSLENSAHNSGEFGLIF